MCQCVMSTSKHVPRLWNWNGSTSGSSGLCRIFPGGASRATCTLSPRQLAEVLRAQDGAVSCQTLSTPPEEDQPGLEEQAGSLLGGVGKRQDWSPFFFFNTFPEKNSSLLTTSVTLKAEVELGELHIGSKFFGVILADVFKPRQRGPFWVSDIQVVHSQDCKRKSPWMKRSIIAFHRVLAAFPLTHVVCDDGERLQVGFPHILSQGVGVVFKVAEQVGSATFRLLDLLPVLLVGRIQ